MLSRRAEVEDQVGVLTLGVLTLDILTLDVLTRRVEDIAEREDFLIPNDGRLTLRLRRELVEAELEDASIWTLPGGLYMVSTPRAICKCHGNDKIAGLEHNTVGMLWKPYSWKTYSGY